MEPTLSAVEWWLQDLKPENPYTTRLAAVRELGRLESSDPSIVRALIAVKEHDASYQMRLAAAEALQAPPHQEVLAHYPELLNSAGDAAELPLPDAPPAVAAEPSPDKPLNPWLTIWIWPRRTIRQIVDADPKYWLPLLIVLEGLARGLDIASNRNLGDTLSLSGILVLAGVMGPLGWLIGVFIWSGLLRWTGSRLGGQAESTEVRAAIVWSGIPAVGILLLWIPILALLGKEMFSSSLPTVEAQPLLALPLLALLLAQTVLSLWSLGLSILCLAEVHRFSVWRSLAATFLSAAIFAVPIACLLIMMVTA